jgi:tetratricopeptide (TPR) repeat protein
MGQRNGHTVCLSEQVVIKAMQQLPAQRYQTAEQMRLDLLQCLPNALPTPASTIQIPTFSPNATIIVPSIAANAASQQQGLICPKCGLVNRLGAKFCAHDGQPLIQGAAIAPPQARPPIYRNAPLQARPVQRPIQARPAQPIRARPVQSGSAQSTQARSVQAIKAQPAQKSNGNATTVADANATYRQGLQYLANKNYAEAVNQFKLARIQGAPLYDVLYNLGRAYRQYGQTVKDTDKKLFTDNMKFAAEQFEEAIRHKSDASDAYFQLGMCYRDLAVYSQAISTFKKALKLTPKDTAIYYQLGMIALEQGSYRDAEAYFKDGLHINPNHALILIAMGRLYADTRQIPSAISILRQATQLDPALWEGWYELGKTHMKNREWKLALSALERARQVGVNVADIYSAMATCNLKLNKKAEARTLLSQALQRDPNNAEALRLQKQL